MFGEPLIVEARPASGRQSLSSSFDPGPAGRDAGQPARTQPESRARRLVRFAGRRLDMLSAGGWLFGLFFAALSLTPSLIPRNVLVQGVLSGCAFAAGYGIGVFLEWLWNFLELRWPNRKVARWVGRLCAAACLVLTVAFLWFWTGWQNSIRAGMGEQPLEATQPLIVALVAVAPAALLVGLGTLIVHGVRVVAIWLGRLIPPRVALVGAINSCRPCHRHGRRRRHCTGPLLRRRPLLRQFRPAGRHLRAAAHRPAEIR